MRTVLVRTAAALALVVAGLAALVVVLILVNQRPGDEALYPPAEGEPAITVFIVQNWLHANLAVPAEPLRRRPGPTGQALQMMPQAQWVKIGWGDVWHYRERGDSWFRRYDLVRSMVWPNNPAVVHFEPAAEAPTPRATGREVLRLELSEEGFERLARRLDATFQRLDGQPVLAGRGREPGSWFFHSVEFSDIRFMCNNWIAALLNEAGVPVNQTLATVTAGLAFSLRNFAGAEPLPGPPGEGRDPGQETPPVNSGVWPPKTDATRQATGAVEFRSYVVQFERAADLATDPAGLVPAGAGGFAQWLEVPADSLVALRRIRRPLEAGADLCGERRATHLALGFEVEDERYEVALAAFAGEPSPQTFCAAYRYRQR